MTRWRMDCDCDPRTFARIREQTIRTLERAGYEGVHPSMSFDCDEQTALRVSQQASAALAQGGFPGPRTIREDLLERLRAHNAEAKPDPWGARSGSTERGILRKARTWKDPRP